MPEAVSNPRWEMGARIMLRKLGTESLERAAVAETYEDFKKSLNSIQPTSESGIDLMQLGTAQRYYAVEPCRLLDTRLASNPYTGPLGDGQIMDLHAKNTGQIALQGGDSAGCNIPSGATGLVVNFTVANPSGNGHLRAYPAGSPLPTASILNFTAARNVTNSTVLTICTESCVADFSIFTLTETDIVADVTGYFAD